MTRPWLLPLNPLYRLATALKNHAYNAHLKPARLTQPVLSIGSLSTGGAGKTPAVLALAELLTRHGYSVDVLSRGYGRSSTQTIHVLPSTPAQDAGDEPLELAQAGLSVFVATTRHAAGQLAEATDSRIHLLDDGFQHRRLHRTYDIVLVTLADLHDHLLPAGNLREPFTSLRRADALILREDEADAILPRMTHPNLWIVRRQLLLPPDTPTNPVAFCGLARPHAFFSMLGQTAAQTAVQIAFPDHHPYSQADVARLETLGGNGFLTTAKDAVKLPPAFRTRVTVARLQTTFVHEDTVLRQLRKVLP